MPMPDDYDAISHLLDEIELLQIRARRIVAQREARPTGTRNLRVVGKGKPSSSCCIDKFRDEELVMRENIDALLAARRAEGQALPLDHLSDQFGLDPIDRLIVVLAATPCIGSDVVRALAGPRPLRPVPEQPHTRPRGDHGGTGPEGSGRAEDATGPRLGPDEVGPCRRGAPHRAVPGRLALERPASVRRRLACHLGWLARRRRGGVRSVNATWPSGSHDKARQALRHGYPAPNPVRGHVGHDGGVSGLPPPRPPPRPQCGQPPHGRRRQVRLGVQGDDARRPPARRAGHRQPRAWQPRDRGRR